MTPPRIAEAAAGWVASLDPSPPSALAERMSAMLAAERSGARDSDAIAAGRSTHVAPSDTSAGSLLDAGVAGLDRMLRSGATTRDAALDLLAVDALVTYAFERAVADAPSFGELDALAAHAMRQIAALADIAPASDGARRDVSIADAPPSAASMTR